MLINLDDNIIYILNKLINYNVFSILINTSKKIKKKLEKYSILYRYLYIFLDNYNKESTINNIAIEYKNLFGLENLKKSEIIKWEDSFRTKNTLQFYISGITLDKFKNNKLLLGIDDYNGIFLSFNIKNFIYTISNIQEGNLDNSRLCVNNRNAYYYIVNSDIKLKNHTKDCGCCNIMLCRYNNIHKSLKKILLKKLYFW